MGLFKRILSKSSESRKEAAPSATPTRQATPGPDRQESRGNHLENLIPLAQGGDAEAARTLGLYYDLTMPISVQNAQQALYWYTLAANAGSPEAMYLAGCKHSNSLAASFDPKKAFAWFKRSAELKYAPAFCNAGLCYKYGWGTEKSYEKAVQCFREALNCDYREYASELHHMNNGVIPRALYHLAECLANGWGAEKDPQAALALYSEALQYRFLYAQQKIDELSGKATPIPNIAKQQYNEAFRLYLDSSDEEEETLARANAGDPSAQYGMAKIALEDNDDQEEALRWATRSAEQGYIHAQSMLGQLYFEAHLNEDERWLNQAIHWCSKAAAQNSAVGWLYLAMCYDGQQREACYLKAAQLGESVAQEKLGEIYAQHQDSVHAEYWLTRALEQQKTPVGILSALCPLLSAEIYMYCYKRQ